MSLGRVQWGGVKLWLFKLTNQICQLEVDNSRIDLASGARLISSRTFTRLISSQTMLISSHADMQSLSGDLSTSTFCYYDNLPVSSNSVAVSHRIELHRLLALPVPHLLFTAIPFVPHPTKKKAGHSFVRWRLANLELGSSLCRCVALLDGVVGQVVRYSKYTCCTYKAILL